MGKRACLWAYDFALDLAEIEFRLENLKAPVKGTTGTQASFLALFDGDHEKVRRLDELICRKIGFAESYWVTGQTYPRKIDSQVLAVLSGIAKAPTKWPRICGCWPIARKSKSRTARSRSARRRWPTSEHQRCERICSLARFVMSLEGNAAATLAVQWLERTLDDSANRRLVLPQSFLATEAVLILCERGRGLVVYPQVIGAIYPSCPSWPRRTSSWRRLLPAATDRTCTSGSASTAWPPAPW